MSKRGVLRAAAVLAGAYALAWLATALVGGPQLERHLLRRMRAEVPAGPPVWDRPDDPRLTPETRAELAARYPAFHAEASAPCPFLVIVDHSSALGPLWGAGHRTSFVWLFGLHWELGTRLSWIS